MESTNGTFANGKPIVASHPIEGADSIRIGNSSLGIVKKIARTGTLVLSEASSLPLPPPAPVSQAADAGAREIQQEVTIERGTYRVVATFGTVLHSMTNYVTTVSGGGGTVSTDAFGNTSGSVNSVHSTTTRHDELYVRYANGKEEVIQAAAANVQVRPGQRVAVIWGGFARFTNGYYFAIQNLDTQRTHYIDTGVAALFPIITALFAAPAFFMIAVMVGAAAKSWVVFAMASVAAVVLSYRYLAKVVRNRRALTSAVHDMARRAQAELA